MSLRQLRPCSGRPSKSRAMRAVSPCGSRWAGSADTMTPARFFQLRGATAARPAQPGRNPYPHASIARSPCATLTHAGRTNARARSPQSAPGWIRHCDSAPTAPRSREAINDCSGSPAVIFAAQYSRRAGLDSLSYRGSSYSPISSSRLSALQDGDD